MKIQSAILTAASGSIGGMTASHNKGGLYFRARTIPTNPNTPQQQAIRGHMAYLATYWRSTLTEAQRETWTFVAENVGIIDALGQSRFLTGLAYFCRANTPRLQGGLALIDEPVGDVGIAQLSDLTFTVSAASQEVSVAFSNTDAWAKAVGGALLVLASQGYNPSVTYHKGPYRYAGKVPGAAVAPTSPVDIALPFPVTQGQRVFFQARATELGSNLSYPFRGFADCGA